MYIVATSPLFRLLVALLIMHSLMSTVVPAYQAPTDSGSQVYVPLIVDTTTQRDSPDQIARDRINSYRTMAGSPPLQLHDALVTAARNHANYAVANHDDGAAWVYGPHGEVVGKPGYTGKMPGDRAAAIGYPWEAGWEVMNFLGEPTRSVDALMGTVYHRVIILDPTLAYMGYGNARTSSNADVIDFGRGAAVLPDAPSLVVFPGPNQIDVPLQGASETPSYLPPAASYPVGYPITMQPIAGSTLMVTQAELRDNGGTLVAIHPSPPNCGSVCYALIPVKPLAAATTYTVHIAGAMEGVPFEITWTFTTRTCPTPLDC